MKKGIIFLLGFLFIAAAYANDGSMEYHPITGRLFFTKNDTISMLWEKVYYKDGQFTTIFQFNNTSYIKQNIKVGFPVINYADEVDLDLCEVGHKDYKNAIIKYVEKEMKFESYLNGAYFPREIVYNEDDPYSVDSGKKYEVFFVGDLKMKPKETALISNVYQQKPVVGENNDGTEYHSIEYILKTGSTWKVPIQHSYIRFEVPYFKNPLDPTKQMYYYGRGSFGLHIKKFYLSVNPAFKKIVKDSDKYVIEWDFFNFLPKNDIEVSWGYTHFFESINKKYTEFTTNKYYWEGDDYRFEPLDDISKMIEYESPSLFFDNNPVLAAELQDEEHFYSFVVALGEGLLEYAHRFTSIGEIDFDACSRFVINGINAVNGYAFKTTLWKGFFKRFKWYKAENAELGFSPLQQKFIEELQDIPNILIETQKEWEEWKSKKY